MLVLTRKLEESIVIGDNIVITILGVERDKVKIGISAPRELLILRGEIFEAVKEQKEIESRLASGQEPRSFQGLRAFLAEQASGAQDNPPGTENK